MQATMSRTLDVSLHQWRVSRTSAWSAISRVVVVPLLWHVLIAAPDEADRLSDEVVRGMNSEEEDRQGFEYRAAR